MENNLIGVVNINKPKGVTSSHVVVRVKKLLGTKKVGHLGTLDPLASGVLPICIGRATRLFDYFLKKQKTYIAQFQFGFQTDTLDLEGQVIKKSDNIPSLEQIEKSIKSNFSGNIEQMPPMFSSKKINGKKACDLARKGVEVELKPSSVEIFCFKVLSQIDEKTFEFEITCSAGTYIRSLARDLGESVNSCATMTALKRTKSGMFQIENSIEYENLSKEVLIKNIIPLENILTDFEKFVLDERTFQNLLNGKKVFVEHENIENLSLVFERKIVGIATVSNKVLKPKTYFN